MSTDAVVPLATEVDTSNWPGSLLRLVKLIGLEATLKLVEHYGGSRGHYIPYEAKPTTAWAQIIGLEAMQILCREFKGQKLDVPLANYKPLKKALIVELWSTTNLSKRAIAIRAHSSEGYVNYVVKQLSEPRPRQAAQSAAASGVHPRQLPLFPGSKPA